MSEYGTSMTQISGCPGVWKRYFPDERAGDLSRDTLNFKTMGFQHVHRQPNWLKRSDFGALVQDRGLMDISLTTGAGFMAAEP